MNSPALLMSTSSLSSVSRKSLANCRTEYMEARSRCLITTLPFPVDRRISSAACSARVRSLHAITSRAPVVHKSITPFDRCTPKNDKSNAPVTDCYRSRVRLICTSRKY